MRPSPTVPIVLIMMTNRVTRRCLHISRQPRIIKRNEAMLRNFGHHFKMKVIIASLKSQRQPNSVRHQRRLHSNTQNRQTTVVQVGMSERSTTIHTSHNVSRITNRRLVLANVSFSIGSFPKMSVGRRMHTMMRPLTQTLRFNSIPTRRLVKTNDRRLQLSPQKIKDSHPPLAGLLIDARSSMRHKCQTRMPTLIRRHNPRLHKNLVNRPITIRSLRRDDHLDKTRHQKRRLKFKHPEQSRQFPIPNPPPVRAQTNGPNRHQHDTNPNRNLSHLRHKPRRHNRYYFPNTLLSAISGDTYTFPVASGVSFIVSGSTYGHAFSTSG